MQQTEEPRNIVTNEFFFIFMKVLHTHSVIL